MNRQRSGCLVVFLIFVAAVILAMCAGVAAPNMDTGNTTKYYVGVRETITGNSSFADHRDDPNATTASHATARTSHPTSPQPGSSMNNPVDITYDNFSAIQEGQYIRVTGPVNYYSTSEGRFSVGGNSVGYLSRCGLRIRIMNDSGDRYYELEAPSVSANGFEDEFNSHAPADISYAPSNIGGTNYCGCTATIVGCIESYTYQSDGSYYTEYRFSSRSRVEELNFYY
ncbi:hypothetical protein SAMN05216413_2267 [Ruminococcaceae bacterium KH2T8]|nr:hypothetical protein SAMN05216413_2267 [Ruminococcaceae bacterium KH2T8]